MPRFFPRVQPEAIGLALFLNAGDPSLEHLEDLVIFLDNAGVDCLELAVPFPDSISDGEVIRRSAMRALKRGIGLSEVVGFVSRVRSRLRRLRIVIVADWSHTVRPLGRREFLKRVVDSGADGLLIHAEPPRSRGLSYEIAGQLALPVVTTCYATSNMRVLVEAARHASAFLYLVAQYGRSGTTPTEGYERLKPLIPTLRGCRDIPIAVGFGVKTRAHLDALRNIGADAAVVGSAFVASLEPLLVEGRSPLAGVHAFLARLRSEGEGNTFVHASPRASSRLVAQRSILP